MKAPGLQGSLPVLLEFVRDGPPRAFGIHPGGVLPKARRSGHVVGPGRLRGFGGLTANRQSKLRRSCFSSRGPALATLLAISGLLSGGLLGRAPQTLDSGGLTLAGDRLPQNRVEVRGANRARRASVLALRSLRSSQRWRVPRTWYRLATAFAAAVEAPHREWRRRAELWWMADASRSP
jgi:hypothetical protein